MKSKKLPNGNYLIAGKYNKFPYEINEHKLHTIMGDLARKFIELRAYIDYLSEEEPEILEVIKEYGYEFDNFVDHLNTLDYIHDELEDFADFLEEDDDIKPKEDLWDLSDEGFTLSYHSVFNNEYIWEKPLNRTEDTDIIEEVYIHNDTILHRKRTIIYDISKPGIKSSISINYDDLPLDDKFMEIIRHSINVETV